MTDESDLTRWFEQSKGRDANAVAALWSHCHARLIAFAERKLAGVPRQAANEEDVALSAFKSFCFAAEQGRLDGVTDRDEMWRVLLTMTARKAVDLRRRELSAKRGAGRVMHASQVSASVRDGQANVWDLVASESPSPDFSLLMADQCEELLRQLTPDQQRIAVLKLDGLSNCEIADHMGCALRTIERRLELIRELWRESVPHTQPDND